MSIGLRAIGLASALAILPGPLGAQTPAETRLRATLVRGVVAARRDLMRDTTILEGCHVRRFLGGSARYRDLLDPATRPFVGECNGSPDAMTMKARDVALLDSATIAVDSATAYLTVYHDTLMYRQSLHFAPSVRELPPGGWQIWKLRSTRVDLSRVLRPPPDLPRHP